MMHLGDAEVKQLCEKLLRSTNENGHLFIRESCFQAHGNSQSFCLIMCFYQYCNTHD